ncbi:hypothetical protein Tco_0569968 [Tanacetum coccineum]
MSFPTMSANWTKPFMDLNKLQEHGVRLSQPFSLNTSLYQANPKESHLIVVKKIFRKSTSGACQLLRGKLVCWSAKKHQFVAMSSAEAEYVAAIRCCANILWMKSQLTYYDIIYEKVPIFCDNTNAIAISNNPVIHSRTKHIDIRYDFIRDHVLKGDIELHFIHTQYQLANIFTKPLDESTFKRLIVELVNRRLFTVLGVRYMLCRLSLNSKFSTHVDFTFDEITFTINNEVALLYPSHPNQECFKDVLDFINKCCLKEAFTRSPTQYKEYLSEFWYTVKTLADFKVWVSTPAGGIRGEIGYNGEIGEKGTLKKSCLSPRWRLLMGQIIQCLGGKIGGLYQISNKDATILYCLANELTINPTQVFSVHNLTLKPNQPEEPPFTDHMKAIYNLDVHVDSKAPKPSSQSEEVPQGKNPGAKMVGEMHKEAQQVAGGPTSLGATSEEGAHPQLSSGSNLSVLVDKTKSTRDGLKTAHTDSGVNEESRADDISLKAKLEYLSNILKDTRSAFFTPDSPPDESIILLDESEEEEEIARNKDTKSTSHDFQKEELEQAKAKAKEKVALIKAKPSYPDINQLTKLLVTSLKPELSKLLALHDFASCLPTELKELPSKIVGLSGEIKELKKHVRDIEIKFPRDLKEIPTYQVSLVQEKLKILDSLPSLLCKVTDTLNRFATMVENASGATSMNVPSAGKSTVSPAEGEKNTKDADTNLKDERYLEDFLMTQYYTKKLLFDKYCDKMLKRKKSPKITKSEVLIKKGHITLKIYKEEGSDEVISNLKFESMKLLQRQLFRSLEDWDVSSLHFMQQYRN